MALKNGKALKRLLISLTGGLGGCSYSPSALDKIRQIKATWNAAGQLGVVKVGGTTVGTYTYDMYNRRARKVTASTTYYVYGPGGLLYGEYTSAGALVREYVYLNGEPLAQVDTGSPEFASTPDQPRNDKQRLAARL